MSTTTSPRAQTITQTAARIRSTLDPAQALPPVQLDPLAGIDWDRTFVALAVLRRHALRTGHPAARAIAQVQDFITATMETSR